MKKPIEVMIGVPIDDGHKICFWESILKLLGSPAPDVSFTLGLQKGDSLVPRARNNLVWDFYTRDSSDYLLFLDSDLEFSPETVLRLIRHQLPICCGLYNAKCRDERWMLNTLPGQTFTADGNLHRVAAAATGAMAIHRSVIGAMIAAAHTWPHWKVRYLNDDNKTERWHLFSHVVVEDPSEWDYPRDLSEDWSFCYFARKLGYDIWLDSGAIFKHEGSILYPLPTVPKQMQPVALSREMEQALLAALTARGPQPSPAVA